MKKVLVLVQTNYEDTELITTLNALSRKKIAYDLYSPEKLDIVKGKTGSMIETQKEFDGTNYDALFVPGGTAAEVMTHNPEVIEIVKSFNKEGKILAAICGGPYLFAKADIIGDRKYTVYGDLVPSENKTSNGVEVDGKLITGKSWEETLPFSFALIDALND